MLSYEPTGKEKVSQKGLSIPDHGAAIKLILDLLVDPKAGILKNLNEIAAAGHRVVHGGDKFSDSVLVTPPVMQAIRDCIPLAPLHNPANIIGIEAMEKILPGLPNVAVFDTAFHQSIPAESYIYGIPYEYYEKHHIRRYGFHGTSHKYVTEEAAKMLNIPLDKFNCITCHLGNGSSMTAVKNGKSYDTSLGMKTIQGLLMGTRCGDIDPGLHHYLYTNLGMSMDAIEDMLTKKSGLLGISGISSDMREIESAAQQGNKRAQLAIDLLNHKIIHYIGAYTALLGRVDAIIFTAGIGENAIDLRAQVVNRLGALGITLDPETNNCRGKAAVISKKSSAITVMVVPTNEELMIALDTKKIVS
ncbi:MAG: acetate kinase [Spirochaetae bacterium HGW-Spirochaetae-6]|nr:MAG: acetate kinase [Spirochaetae bacterium HGW-Spirochaetae-6]